MISAHEIMRINPVSCWTYDLINDIILAVEIVIAYTES